LKFLFILLFAVNAQAFTIFGWNPGSIFNAAGLYDSALTTNSSLQSGANGQVTSVALNATTTPKLLAQANSGAPSFISNSMVAGVPVTNLKFVNAYAQTSTTGDLDL